MGFGKLLVGVTGNAMDVDVLEYEAAGADIILTKPMRMDALQRLLDFCEQRGRCASHWGDPDLSPVSIFTVVPTNKLIYR